jgi:broad specificity phosphatase PhoE
MSDATPAPLPRIHSRRLLVIRHAQSEHHLNGLTGGWTDTGLSDLGREQARRLAARLGSELAGVPVTLCASDLRRGIETAAPIAAALGVPIQPEPRLREHNNGAAAGLTVAEASARYPEGFAGSWRADFRPFPDAETWREFNARICSFLEELPEDGPMPLLVTHGGTAMNIIAWWLRLGFEALQGIWFHTPPAGITVLRTDDGPTFSHRGLERLGDTAHLHGLTPPPSLLSAP